METVHGLATQNKDDVIQKLEKAEFNSGYGENYVPFYEYSKVEYTSRLVNLVKDLDDGQIDLDGSSDRIELTTPDNILVDFQANEKDGKPYVLVEITGVNRNGEGSRFITGGLNTAVTDRPRGLQMISEETFAHDVTEFINNYRIFKVTIFDKPYYLSEYLLFSGFILKSTNRLADTYVHAVYEKVDVAFKKEGSFLSPSFVPFYTQLVLTALSADITITEEMVHDSWSIAMMQKDPMRFHFSMIPFGYLTCEVQDLDTPYVEKLNEVLNYFRELKQLVEVVHDSE